MRKLCTGLVVALLSAAPAVALAGPDKDTKSSDPWAHEETFEWTSSSQGARLGVMVMSLTNDLRGYFGAPADKGVLVAKVEPNSAAAKAGVKVGDVLVAVKGTNVDEASDVIEALADAKQGDKVKLSVVRDHKPLAIDATIGAISSRNAPSQMPSHSQSMNEHDWFRHVFPWFDETPGNGPKST